MLLMIMLIYLAAVVCIMLLQYSCYKKHCHMIATHQPADYSEVSSHLKAA
jgi:hypothetical protein